MENTGGSEARERRDATPQPENAAHAPEKVSAAAGSRAVGAGMVSGADVVTGGCRFPDHSPETYCAACVDAGRQFTQLINGEIRVFPTRAPAAAGSRGHRDFVTICAWCPELHVLRIDRRPGDLIMFVLSETDRG